MAKLPLDFVNYRDREVRDVNCHRCAHRIDHGNLEQAGCTLMKGPVNSLHVCDLFERKPVGSPS